MVSQCVQVVGFVKVLNQSTTLVEYSLMLDLAGAQDLEDEREHSR